MYSKFLALNACSLDAYVLTDWIIGPKVADQEAHGG